MSMGCLVKCLGECVDFFCWHPSNLGHRQSFSTEQMESCCFIWHSNFRKWTWIRSYSASGSGACFQLAEKKRRKIACPDKVCVHQNIVVCSLSEFREGWCFSQIISLVMMLIPFNILWIFVLLLCCAMIGDDLMFCSCAFCCFLSAPSLVSRSNQKCIRS